MPRYQDNYCVPGCFSCQIEFVSPGLTTFTVPTSVTCVSFEVWGGGGGGGAVCCCDCYKAGPPGAGGGYAKTTITTSPGVVYSICVGAGGMSCINSFATAANHWCCYGNPGCGTYVTGTGLSNFCATGGEGGRGDCYYGCGCNVPAGIGYGGQINSCGSYGGGGNSSNQCQVHFGMSGGSPNGASGTVMTSDNCRMACWAAPPGMFPGGGGSSQFANQCCCCGQAGVGGNGMVRISY